MPPLSDSGAASATSSPPGRLVDFDLAPGAVYALGLTFAEHIRETGEPAGAPAVFRKRYQPSLAQPLLLPSAAALHAAITGHDALLAARLQHCFTELPALLDYEVEIGIALLQPVSLAELQRADCRLHYGLFVANDITARSVQIAGEAARERLALWSAAKSFAGFLPVGAQLWLPQQPDLERFPELLLQTRVNGELRQSASSRQMIYSPRQLLGFAAASAPGRQLQAHDLILCGTPAGVGLSIPRWKRRLTGLLPARLRVAAAIRANRDNPRLLKAGDRVVCSAGWLGQCSISIE